MSEQLYTVEQAAQRLNLHPKTVLRLIHEGRLHGTRIGKSYRILRSHLDAFVGGSTPAAGAGQQTRVTIVVDLPDITIEKSSRLTTRLQAALTSQETPADPIHLDTAYDPQREHLKIVIIGSLGGTSALLRMLQTFLEPA
jgi:excisionase family DNA binding protein